MPYFVKKIKSFGGSKYINLPWKLMEVMGWKVQDIMEVEVFPNKLIINKITANKDDNVKK